MEYYQKMRSNTKHPLSYSGSMQQSFTSESDDDSSNRFKPNTKFRQSRLTAFLDL